MSHQRCTFTKSAGRWDHRCVDLISECAPIRSADDRFSMIVRSGPAFNRIGPRAAFDLAGCCDPARCHQRSSALLLAVQFNVTLGCLTCVMRRMQMMPVGSMRMMRRQFVFASTMMLGGLAMMFRRVFMVFSGFRVMFFKFLWHSIQSPKFSALSTRKA